MGILAGLLGLILIAAVHLTVIALDVTLFFLVVRCLAIKWPVALVTTFDDIGSPIVDRLLQAAQPFGSSRGNRFLAVSLTLTVVRLVLVASVQTFLVEVP